MKIVRSMFLRLAAIFVMVVLAACGETAQPTGSNEDNSASGASEELRKVDFIFSWKYSGHRSPYLVAKDQGFFEEEGLDVNLQEGVGSDKSIDLLANNRVDFAEIEFGSLVVAVEQGRPLRTVATILQTSPQCIASWSDAGISGPNDLEGKKIVAVPGASDTQMLEPLYELNEVDAAAVETISADFNTRDQIFLSRKADAMPTFINDSFVRFQQEGHDIRCFLYADYGVDVIGNGVAVNSSLIQEDPELVAAFVRALHKGWEYAIANPDEAIDSLIAVAPLLKAEEELPKLEASEPLMEGAAWGFTDPERAEESANLLLEAGLVDQVTDPTAYYTNEFVPE